MSFGPATATLRREATAALAALAIMSGCGDEPAPRASKRTATPTKAPAATPVPAARTAQACFELWNATARPGTAGQKSPADFIAELAAERYNARAREDGSLEPVR